MVAAHCDLEGVSAGEDCRIGPYARLRPGSELAEGVHVGNFVETKKTRLGKEARPTTSAYLGDAQIGAAVNIGAGTITCNYDGVNKFVTTIGDGAFIGSNSALVAPVEIGAEATIGAGSVITRNAPRRTAHGGARTTGLDRRLEAAEEEVAAAGRWGRAGCAAAGGAAPDQVGNTIATARPPPSRLPRLMRPPCASAISRASARPRPVPLRLVE